MASPIKINPKTEAFPIFLLLASLALGAYFYAHFPAVVAMHWNYQGVPNGYIGRFWGAFLMPVILIGLYLLFLVLPVLDPKKAEYRNFAHPYNVIRNSIVLALVLISAAAGFDNLGDHLPIKPIVTGIIGLLFIVIGWYLGEVKPNWFVGIRTPWTLSSEAVWDKTNQLGGQLFMALGVIVIVFPYLPETFGVALLVLGLVVAVFGSIIYSYVAYEKEQKPK